MKHYKSVKDFLKEYPIHFSCKWVGERPDGLMPNRNHYKVVITHNKKQMSVFFSQGYGITTDPTLESVIPCVSSDAVAGIMGLEDFCSAFGYDLEFAGEYEELLGVKVHRACRATHDKWLRVFGEVVSISY